MRPDRHPRRRCRSLTALITMVVAIGCVASALGPASASVTTAPSGANVILQWNSALLEAVKADKSGPPMVARAVGILHTCTYDAWAAYDPVAVGTRLGDRPA